MIKGSSNSGTTRPLPVPGFPQLWGHQGSWPLPPIHRTLGSWRRAARRNKLKTKEALDILPGCAGSPAKSLEGDRGGAREPVLTSFSNSSGLSKGSQGQGLKARPGGRVWSTGEHSTGHSAYALRMRGHGWTAAASFLPGVRGFKVNSS